MESLVCNNCNYRFEAKVVPKLCPYCGENRLKKESNADDLLDEVLED